MVRRYRSSRGLARQPCFAAVCGIGDEQMQPAARLELREPAIPCTNHMSRDAPRRATQAQQ
jgi:hypothetical protein